MREDTDRRDEDALPITPESGQQLSREGAAEAPPGTAGPEVEVQHEPQVLAGEDEIPRQPAPPLDPFTPEPGPRAGEQRAFAVLRWAWIPVLVVAAIIVVAALR